MCEHAFMKDTDYMRNKMNAFHVCRDPWQGPGSEGDQATDYGLVDKALPLLKEGKELAQDEPEEAWSQVGCGRF